MISNLRGGTIKKTLILTILFIITITTSTLACAFHNLIPEISSDDYVDTYYYTYPIDPPIMYQDTSIDEGYIYVIETKNFFYVEASTQDIGGLYDIPSEDIATITQDGTNPLVINVTLEDGYTSSIDINNQLSLENNAFYYDEDYNILIKDEYQYLYEDEDVGTSMLTNATAPTPENNEQLKEDNSTNIDDEDISSNNSNIFIPIVIVLIVILGLLLILRQKKKGNKNGSKNK